MKRIAKFHFSFLLAALGILLLSLTGCGVRGALYLPPIPPQPTKPSLPEPIGIQYPLQNSPSDNISNKP